jgi:TRAP-type C4-dicarboxylate transport system substrate-binding protein
MGLVALVFTFFFGVQFVGAAEPIVLKASCFLDKNQPVAAKAWTWIDNVNKELKGKVEIKYVGGPEVIPVFEQIEAARKGIVDISFTSGSHYGTQLPSAITLHLSKLLPWEERKSGYVDIMVKEHEKLGVRYLGRWIHGGYYMWLREPITTPSELSGKRLRGHPVYDQFYKNLGISSVTIQPSDVYTALEKGMTDGACYVMLGPRELGWTRVVKYVVDHPFYTQNNTNMVVNINTWNKLPADIKAKLQEITESFEHEMVAYFVEEINKEYDLVKKSGVKPIVFSPADAKRFVDLAYESGWADLEKKIPDLVPPLRKALGY